MECVDVIKQIGIYNLAGFDGCLCGSFELQHIHVDMNCRKSSADVKNIFPDFYGLVVRVYSKSLVIGYEQLKLIADEVVKQLGNDAENSMVRFCEWEQDRDINCIYCNKKRENKVGYLCNKCLGNPCAAYHAPPTDNPHTHEH